MCLVVFLVFVSFALPFHQRLRCSFHRPILLRFCFDFMFRIVGAVSLLAIRYTHTCIHTCLGKYKRLQNSSNSQQLLLVVKSKFHFPTVLWLFHRTSSSNLLFSLNLFLSTHTHKHARPNTLFHTRMHI